MPIKEDDYSLWNGENDSESEIQKQICKFLDAVYIMYYRSKNMQVKQNSGGKEYWTRTGVNGQPDITGVLPGGRAFYIEVKSKGGKVSPEQKSFHEAAVKNGAVIIVARSVDDVTKVLIPILNYAKSKGFHPYPLPKISKQTDKKQSKDSIAYQKITDEMGIERVYKGALKNP